MVGPLLSFLADRAEELVTAECENTGKPFQLTMDEEIPPMVDFLFRAGRQIEALEPRQVDPPAVQRRDGVDAAEEICSCPGVDGVLIGPVDLALSMGLEPLSASPHLEEAISRLEPAFVEFGHVRVP